MLATWSDTRRRGVRKRLQEHKAERCHASAVLKETYSIRSKIVRLIPPYMPWLEVRCQPAWRKATLFSPFSTAIAICHKV